MTTVRDIVDVPGMPTWVRFALAVMAASILRLAAEFAQPMVHGGWTWSHGIATLVALAVGLDLLFAGGRKRWPLVLFADQLVALLVGRSR